ncbi:unnamed protein product [Arctia plantaginis]|uniref:Uncharacterized protein n=1 Tax=Arctia plantaginis TaxID=874455 RepID=A0A8S1BGI9_ARCPL|nr:unnamed protein product [Arctia plantaginis]
MPRRRRPDLGHRKETQKKLEAPYEGPFKVLKREGKCYTMELTDRNAVASVDCLQPAFIVNTTKDTNVIHHKPPTSTGSHR